MNCLLFLFFFLQVTSNAFATSNSYPYRGNMLRNNFLRILLAIDYKKQKQAVKAVKSITEETLHVLQERTIVKLGELSTEYYNLSDEDRYFIETILDMLL